MIVAGIFTAVSVVLLSLYLKIERDGDEMMLIPALLCVMGGMCFGAMAIVALFISLAF